MTELGRIDEVDLRSVFKSEAHAFTPWLAGHLDQLSERLGIEIVDPEVEKRVGDFSLDIFGSDVNTRKVVAIENQLESSDHTHLGQLITYASGVEAGIVVWITPELRMEHQQALDWLNENSDTSFFGVELRAIRIGDSEPAVDFRIRVAPNDWQRGIRLVTGKGEISPRDELYRQFFEELVDRYWENHPERRKPKAQPQSWFQFGAGKSGFSFAWAFKSGKRLSTELYIDTGESPEINAAFLRNLRESVGDSPEGLGGLSWEELPNARACRIAEYTEGEIETASSDDRVSDRLIAWAVDRMSRFEAVFSKPIKNL
jgi:hypothetical protein